MCTYSTTVCHHGSVWRRDGRNWGGTDASLWDWLSPTAESFHHSCRSMSADWGRQFEWSFHLERPNKHTCFYSAASCPFIHLDCDTRTRVNHVSTCCVDLWCPLWVQSLHACVQSAVCCRTCCECQWCRSQSPESQSIPVPGPIPACSST